MHLENPITLNHIKRIVAKYQIENTRNFDFMSDIQSPTSLNSGSTAKTIDPTKIYFFVIRNNDPAVAERALLEINSDGHERWVLIDYHCLYLMD